MHAYQPQSAPASEGAEHASKHYSAQDLHLHTQLPSAAGHLLLPADGAHGCPKRYQHQGT